MKSAADYGLIAVSRRVSIWTDGACSGNPGPGGWGAVLLYGAHKKELKGGEALTTNNRMELTAAIEALKSLKRPCAVSLHTDSQYLRGGVTGWIDGWKRNGWRTADKKPVKNEDLWRRLDAAARQHEIEWLWVRGHAGDEHNERADELAREGMAPYRPFGRAGETSERSLTGLCDRHCAVRLVDVRRGGRHSSARNPPCSGSRPPNRASHSASVAVKDG